mmetsp:Transcript_17477/g.36127  ORF Transcript_17477/g.36127 Transcript_17477/m.36127 type:complete len:254 (-) Transcript_17477:4434-5195(-)
MVAHPPKISLMLSSSRIELLSAASPVSNSFSSSVSSSVSSSPPLSSPTSTSTLPTVTSDQTAASPPALVLASSMLSTREPSLFPVSIFCCTSALTTAAASELSISTLKTTFNVDVVILLVLLPLLPPTIIMVMTVTFSFSTPRVVASPSSTLALKVLYSSLPVSAGKLASSKLAKSIAPCTSTFTSGLGSGSGSGLPPQSSGESAIVIQPLPSVVSSRNLLPASQTVLQAPSTRPSPLAQVSVSALHTPFLSS